MDIHSVVDVDVEFDGSGELPGRFFRLIKNRIRGMGGMRTPKPRSPALQNRWFCTAPGRRTARSASQPGAEPLGLDSTRLQNEQFCTAPARRTAPAKCIRANPPCLQPPSVQNSLFSPTLASGTTRSAQDFSAEPIVLQCATLQNPRSAPHFVAELLALCG